MKRTQLWEEQGVCVGGAPQVNRYLQGLKPSLRQIFNMEDLMETGQKFAR